MTAPITNEGPAVGTPPDAAPDAAPRRNSWVMLGLAWLTYFYFGTLALAFAPMLKLIERDLGISSTEAGILLGTYPVSYICFASVASRVADRVGVKAATIAGVAVFVASTVGRALAPTYGWMLAAMALFGVGGPVVSTVLPKLVAEWFHGRHRTVAAGVYTTGSSLGWTTVVALTSSVFLPVFGSWRSVLWADAVFGVGLLGLWVLMGRVPAGVVVRADAGSRARARAPVWKSRQVWAVVLVGLACFVMASGLNGWLPSILQGFGVSAAAAGFFIGMKGIGQACSTTPPAASPCRSS